MITPIFIKKFDRRTLIFIDKSIDISIDDIKIILSEFFIKCKITQDEDNDINKVYKISLRFTENQKNKILNQLYRSVGIDYNDIKAKNREIARNRISKKKIIKDKNVIIGFSGNLIVDFEFKYKTYN